MQPVPHYSVTPVFPLEMKIDERILDEMARSFRDSKIEQGFMLGCAEKITQIDNCEKLPARNAGMYYYEPDVGCANAIIDHWQSKKICFCGLVHSHVVPKSELSENDEEYARTLFSAFNLPVFWFCVALVESNVIHFKFYAVSQKDNEITIFPKMVVEK